MKKIKILVVLAIISIATFYSCTDNNPIENEAVTQKSIANRTAMNELKIANNISGRDANATASSPFCFEFVYPITLSYNTGTTITVASLQGLLTILASETPNLYVDGIAFPFQVTNNGAVSTISTEVQYMSLLLSCGFSAINTDLVNSFCFDLVFPITILNDNNQEVTITSLQQFTTYLNNPNNGGQTQFVYPISVNYNNQVVVIDNIYELYQMINNCDVCICTLEYAPVCVQTATGIVEFGNSCFAICAGYDQNDFIQCTNSTTCSVSNLTAIPGACNGNGTNTHPLTINFSYTNAPGTTFDVRDETNTLVGTYPLSSLPLTIPNFPANGSIVNVQLGSNCSVGTQFTQVPICTNCGCPSGGTPVCVQTTTGIVQYGNSCLAICAGHSQNSFVTCPTPSNFSTQLGTCFTIAYPVQVQYQGALVTVNSNGELLQYYFPTQGPIPAMVYPITATFGNQTLTFANQATFQSQISATCN